MIPDPLWRSSCGFPTQDMDIRENSLFFRVFTGIYVDLKGLWLTP